MDKLFWVRHGLDLFAGTFVLIHMAFLAPIDGWVIEDLALPVLYAALWSITNSMALSGIRSTLARIEQETRKNVK